MKSKKFIHGRIFIIVLVLVFIVVVSLVSSYAWFTWSSTDNTKLTVTIGELADISFQTGNQINAELTPVFNYYNGEKTTFNVNNKDVSGASIRYIVKLNITTIPLEFRNASVKYTLVKNGSVVATGDLSDATDGSTIEIYSDTLFSGVVPYELYLYIDGNVENNTSMIGKTLIGNITVEAFEFTGNTLVELISEKYNSAPKTEVTNNNIKYNYATSVSLMNDRLGGTTTDYDSGNIRYYGANPNNYVDIGDRYVEEIGNWERLNLGISSQSECYIATQCNNLISAGFFNTEDECTVGLPLLLEQYGYSSVDDLCSVTIQETPILYRIIGVFKDIKLSDGTTQDLVKVVRNDSIGIFAWDGSMNEQYDWSRTTLNKILNDTYYNSGISEHTYLNILTFESKTADLTKIGLDISLKSKLETVVWNLGISDLERSFMSFYPNDVYQFERANKVYQGGAPILSEKVALMYPSDYGYATDFVKCRDSNISNYYNALCYQNDWIYKYSDNGEWLVSSHAEGLHSALLISNSGMVLANEDIYGYNVRPVFYLKSGVSVVSGEGTEISPYIVK